MVCRIDWLENEYGAFCPCCQESIAAGSESYDWGCDTCGYPDPQAIADYHAGDDTDYLDDGDPYDFARDSRRDDRDIHGIK